MGECVYGVQECTVQTCANWLVESKNEVYQVEVREVRERVIARAAL